MIPFLLAGILYVTDPIAVMREDPACKSKVVSQAIFSEEIQVLGKERTWTKIQTPDGYSGWVEGLKCVEGDYHPDVQIERLVAYLYDVEDTEWGPVLTLPYASKLKVVDASSARWLKVELPDHSQLFVQRGDVEPQDKSDLIAFSLRFLNTPYVFGGRSSFGYDCSSFVQMLYRHIGIDLKRDARQQIADPHLEEISFSSLMPKDLVFFGKEEGKIQHVGMCIGEDKFIHACVQENKPWVRISSIHDFEWSGNPNAYYPYRTAKRLKS